MNNRVTLHDSFSYLLIHIRNGTFKGDNENCLYYFGSTESNEAIQQAVKNYNFPQEKLPEVLSMLANAREQGRVFWRSPYQDQERERFQRMLSKAREMGAVIPEWSSVSFEHYDAFWNIPAMRRFLGDSVEYANRI